MKILSLIDIIDGRYRFPFKNYELRVVLLRGWLAECVLPASTLNSYAGWVWLFSSSSRLTQICTLTLCGVLVACNYLLQRFSAEEGEMTCCTCSQKHNCIYNEKRKSIRNNSCACRNLNAKCG